MRQIYIYMGFWWACNAKRVKSGWPVKQAWRNCLRRQTWPWWSWDQRGRQQTSYRLLCNCFSRFGVLPHNNLFKTVLTQGLERSCSFLVTGPVGVATTFWAMCMVSFYQVSGPGQVSHARRSFSIWQPGPSCILTTLPWTRWNEHQQMASTG